MLLPNTSPEPLMPVYVPGNNVEPRPMSRETIACRDLQARSPERLVRLSDVLAGNEEEVAVLIDPAEVARRKPFADNACRWKQRQRATLSGVASNNDYDGADQAETSRCHRNAYLCTAFSSHSIPRPGPRAVILPLSGSNGSVRTAPAKSRYSHQDAVGEQAIVCALASM